MIKPAAKPIPIKEVIKQINAGALVKDRTQHCFEDCKNCGGEGFVVIPAEKTGDVARWRTCPNSAAWEADRYWEDNQRRYGLENVSLEGKPATEIRFPEKALPGQETMHALCAKILAERPPKSWGLLLGGFGRGKSHYLVAMVNEFRLQRRGATYTQAHQMVAKLQDTFDGKGLAAEVRTFFETPPFLAVDELDAVKWSEWTGAELFAILEARRLAERSTMFTTNQNIQELQERSPILQKLMSRIAGNGELVAVEGVDHRMVKEK